MHICIGPFILVNCRWSEWTGCSTTCAGGKRSRYVVTDARHGGNCNSGNPIHTRWLGHGKKLVFEQDFCHFEPCTG